MLIHELEIKEWGWLLPRPRKPEDARTSGQGGLDVLWQIWEQSQLQCSCWSADP